MQRDGFVQWQGAYYGVPVQGASHTVQVQPRQETLEIWSGNDRLVVHPLATRARQRLIAPGQWAGLRGGDQKPPKEPLATYVPEIEVEERPLATYARATGQ